MSGRKWIAGFVLILLGALLLSRTMGFMHFTFGQMVGYLFPLFLIAVGLWVLARTRSRDQADRAQEATTGQWACCPPQDSSASADRRYRTPPPGQPDLPPPPGKGPRVSASPEQATSGKVRYSKFIGDLYADCSGVELQNVEVSSFIGDVEVKLHGGRLAKGLNRMIISGFVGDVRILVPEGMQVLAQSSNFIGDIEMMGKRSSGFGNSLDAQTPGYSEAESKLYIASNHFIGDVRIYVV